MQADLPHTLYRNSKDKVSEADIDEATRLTMEAYEKKERLRKEQEGYTLEEVFNGKVEADSQEQENKE